LTKEPKTYTGEKTALQHMVLRKLNIYMQKTETRPVSHPVQKSTPGGSDLNVRPKTLKLLQENIRKALEDTGIGNYFLNRTLTAQEIAAKIDKWDCITLKGFCTLKETVSKLLVTASICFAFPVATMEEVAFFQS
jgi:hypothetical protein